MIHVEDIHWRSGDGRGPDHSNFNVRCKVKKDMSMRCEARAPCLVPPPPPPPPKKKKKKRTPFIHKSQVFRSFAGDSVRLFTQTSLAGRNHMGCVWEGQNKSSIFFYKKKKKLIQIFYFLHYINHFLLLFK
jgi:hypothetical protein